MDRQMEELQFLGFLGICFEACKLIASRRKLFSQIALSLILPLPLLLLANNQISDLLFHKISRTVLELEFTPEGSDAQKSNSLRILSEFAAFWLYRVVYLVGLIVFSLFSTSAVVYTVACAYTAKYASFRNVMTVVPKVWKRLMVTFLCRFAIVFVCSFVFVLILLILLIFTAGENSISTLIAVVIITLFYIVGLVYIRIVWYLADAVSVLEDVYGVSALQRSMNLVRGNKGTVFVILVVLEIPSFGIGLLFGISQYMGLGVKLAFAVVILVAMTLSVLVQLVVQTVVYFVCKSHHHESIDKSILSDHLDVYSGEYLPLKEKDVQLEQCHV